MRRQTLLLFLSCVSIFIYSENTFAKTLFVSDSGGDSGGCGLNAGIPCRSIRQAIANASNGDRIDVGSGNYAEGGMLDINKSVTIVSGSGADFTIIRFPEGSAGSPFGVLITADNVRFGGGIGKGFSVVSGSSNCNVGIRSLGSGSIIDGNTVTGCQWGFHATGQGAQLTHNRAAFNRDVGFVVRSEGAFVTENIATQNTSTGFVTESLDWHMIGNLSIANNGDGVTVDGNGVFLSNAIIGNTRTGLVIHGFLVGGIVNLTISSNSFYGNRAQPTNTNCAIFNNTFTVINAQNNFWGLPTGPGPDPADVPCGNQILVSPWLNDPVATSDVFGPLIQGIRQIGGVGFPSGISGWSNQWQIIATGDDDTFPKPTHFAMARPYGLGRVFAVGHESILTTGGLPRLDNTRLVSNVLQWLDQSGKHKVLYTTGHDEGIGPNDIDTMRDLFPDFSFDPVEAPLGFQPLPSEAVLIIGHAKSDFTRIEVNAIDNFVARGGGLLLAAQGWAWEPFWHRPMDEFPMNVVGERFEIRWLPQNLRDTSNETPSQEVIYHVFYADQRTLNPIRQINTFVSLTPSNFRTVPWDSLVCGPGGDAMFLFDALMVFNNGSPPVSSLDIRVTELSNHTLLQALLPLSSAVVTPDGAAKQVVGTGGTLDVPFHDGYADGIFSNPGEFVSVPFTICLKQLKQFQLFVDVYGRSESLP